MAGKKTRDADDEPAPQDAMEEAVLLSRDAQWSTYDVVPRPPDDTQKMPLDGLLTEQTRGTAVEEAPE